MKRNVTDNIQNIKDNVTNIFICYNNLTNKDAIENRKSLDIDTYKNQAIADSKHILALRNNALKIFDKCNELLMQ